MIGTKRKAGRDTAGQAFAAEGNGHFTGKPPSAGSSRPRPRPWPLRALCLLDSAFSAGCTIQAALQQVLEDTARRQEGGLAERDRHLAAELAYGTLRMENRLAFVLGKVLRQPLKLPCRCGGCWPWRPTACCSWIVCLPMPCCIRPWIWPGSSTGRDWPG